MNDMLEVIGWKKYGRWNPSEIVLDVVALTAILAVIVLSYHYIKL